MKDVIQPHSVFSSPEPIKQHQQLTANIGLSALELSQHSRLATSITQK